ncbi:hypothetical protein TRFO_33022 [Tritrichomonas foetus]|uniref:Uncharacterized protein n=1 Tax=Tritrichomonas foetus TaxID=1144522 RepID=A0A1J4JPN1_9EUKA|nr:hypothetical protein TRFO_33022 [Tritrichomonas foetus]|eukprot:OHT00368.1 hypothetical protein TRFO_33022 [Tritrichomonas foetus]
MNSVNSFNTNHHNTNSISNSFSNSDIHQNSTNSHAHTHNNSHNHQQNHQLNLNDSNQTSSDNENISINPSIDVSEENIQNQVIEDEINESLDKKFIVPGGYFGVALVVVPLLACSVFMAVASGWQSFLICIAIVAALFLLKGIEIVILWLLKKCGAELVSMNDEFDDIKNEETKVDFDRTCSSETSSEGLESAYT